MKNFFHCRRGVSYWAIIIVLAFMIVAMIVAFWPQESNPEDNISPTYIRLWNKARNQTLEISEKARIEKWIVDNRLNEYGDMADTLYAGGTPLFDESTGKIMDRYDYILKEHQDKPWEK